MSNWKPGAVYLIREGEGYEGDECILFRAGGDWVDADGDRRGISDEMVARIARRLVLIDPEDREQVDRLAYLLVDARAADSIGHRQLAAALREFANPKPPKPEEPTGRGAVVVDRYGFPWTRYSFSEPHDGEWINEDGLTKQWAELDLTGHATVSEGVPE